MVDGRVQPAQAKVMQACVSKASQRGVTLGVAEQQAVRMALEKGSVLSQPKVESARQYDGNPSDPGMVSWLRNAHSKITSSDAQPNQCHGARCYVEDA